MKPQFFVGIGAQKAGTSWLARYFSRHPDVAFSPIKELHYFDSVYRKDLCASFDEIKSNFLHNNISKYNKGISSREIAHATAERIRCLSLRLEMKYNPQRYKDYFKIITTESHRAFGEITPAYSLLDAVGFKAIRAMYADAKFIFILRDPVERYWSKLRKKEQRQGIEQFNAKENILTSLENPQEFLRTDYKRTLTELYKVVPRQDVCVIFYEKIMHQDTHERELRKITDFLGIEYINGDINTRVNPSQVKELPDEYIGKIANKFRHVYEYIEESKIDSLPTNWLRNFSTIETSNSTASPVEL